MNKVITWNPLREMEEAPQNRFNPFFLGGFPNRIGRGEIPSLTVADWSPEVDISEDDHGYLLKADLPEMKKDDVKVTVEDGILSVSGERKVERKIRKRNSIASNDALALSDAASRCLKMPTARK
jgi:HSP20 family protein